MAEKIEKNAAKPNFVDEILNSKHKLPVKISKVANSESSVSRDSMEYAFTMNFFETYQIFLQIYSPNSSLTNSSDIYKRLPETKVHNLDHIVNSRNVAESALTKNDFHIILPRSEKTSKIKNDIGNHSMEIQEQSQKSSAKKPLVMTFQPQESNFLKKLENNGKPMEKSQPNSIKNSMEIKLEDLKEKRLEKSLEKSSGKLVDKSLPENPKNNDDLSRETQKTLMKSKKEGIFQSKFLQNSDHSINSSLSTPKPMILQKTPPKSQMNPQNNGNRKENMYSYLVHQNPNLSRIIRKHQTPEPVRSATPEVRLRTPPKTTNISQGSIKKNEVNFTPPQKRQARTPQPKLSGNEKSPKNIIQTQRTMMRNERGQGKDVKMRQDGARREIKNKWLEKKNDAQKKEVEKDAQKKEGDESVHMKINLEKFKRPEPKISGRKTPENSVNLTQFQKKGNNILHYQRNQLFNK